MSDIIFTILAWTLLLAGVFVAWWWGWRDTGKGTRRCPKCGYDMRATSGLRCPECGRAWKTEKQLHRARRRWGRIALGVFIAILSYPALKWPLYLTSGPIGFVPRVATLALLPEISGLLRHWGAPGKLYGDLLARRLSDIQQFDAIERFVFARTYRRVLLTRSWSSAGMANAWGVELVGDQVGELVDPLTDLIADESYAVTAMGIVTRIPRREDQRLFLLTKPVRKRLETMPMSQVSHTIPVQLKWWGDSPQNYCVVARRMLRAQRPGGSEVDLLTFLWQCSGASVDDLCLFQQRLESPNFESTFAAMCLADLGVGSAPVIDEVIRSNPKPSSTLVNCLAMPLMSMRHSARPALPWLDSLVNHRNPLTASSAFLAALSIRGEADSAYAYWLACIESDSESNASAPPYQWMTPQIIYMDVPVDWKVQGLVYAIRRDLQDVRSSGGGVGVGVWVATDCLAKLGSDAAEAVPELVRLIRPGVPDYFVEHLLDAMAEIRSHHRFDIDSVEAAVREWERTGSSPKVHAALADLRRAGGESAGTKR